MCSLSYFKVFQCKFPDTAFAKSFKDLLDRVAELLLMIEEG